MGKQSDKKSKKWKIAAGIILVIQALISIVSVGIVVWFNLLPLKYLVLIGQTSKAIADCCEKHGFTNYEFATSMDEAVEKCASHAKPGEAVLLSPACASWGMFDNYEQRGRIFKELVRKLPD